MNGDLNHAETLLMARARRAYELGRMRGALLRSAYYGLAVGAITVTFPLSLLRPCCRPGVNGLGPTCTMPEACVLAGALLAVPFAVLAMHKSEGRRNEAAFGMMLGMLSLATVKCSALFVGESLGLLSGLAFGIVATFGVSAWTVRRA